MLDATMNQAAVIKAAADQILALEDQIAATRELISDLRAQIKGTGVSMADFNAAFRLYKMEVGDRTEAMESFRTCFSALGLDDQGDLFVGGIMGD